MSLDLPPLHEHLDEVHITEACRRAAARGLDERATFLVTDGVAAGALSGRDDELVALPDLADLAEANGFALAGVGEATQREWDEFESGFTARYAAWVATHEVGHPDAAQAQAAAARQRTRYLRGYRGVLGMGYLQLVAV